jgi:hypothetical protein
VPPRPFTCLWFLLAATDILLAADAPYFQITVVDDQTNRGVPLVELKTVNGIRFYTDSAGVVAFNEPGLMDRPVFFWVKSHGYEFPKDGFNMAGKILETKAGGSAELRIKRLNIAERLYRVTGQGIYRDSVLLGRPVPTKEPLLNAAVMGQDSIQEALYGGRLYWFWGDTGWPKYPLGNFHMTGATARLPSDGGLDPDKGVDLTYFFDPVKGLSKEMAPNPGPGPVWADAFVVLPDETGRDRMYAAYARVNAAMQALESGFIRYNDEKQVFEKVAEFDVKSPLRPTGHPLRYLDGGSEYLLFNTPFPWTRVRAQTKAYLDVSQCEGYTCLTEGGRVDSPKIDRDSAGRIRYAWKCNTPPLDFGGEKKLIDAGQLKPDEALVLLREADTGKAVIPHAGSVYWNPWRHRWITIRCETFGTSMLGETWYAEADSPLGPWVYARKIVTHDKYSFYNPKQHPYFDKDGGRIIYFEGTYTMAFSGTTEETPRYDYNQIMYRLDLADPRLVLPVPVYRAGEGPAAVLRTRDQLPAAGTYEVAFFAPDRAGPGLVAVYEEKAAGGGGARLRVASPAQTATAHTGGTVRFYALPADAKNPPATSVPLYEYVGADGRHTYAVEGSEKGTQLFSKKPVCRVWRSPTRLAWPVTPNPSTISEAQGRAG